MDGWSEVVLKHFQNRFDRTPARVPPHVYHNSEPQLANILTEKQKQKLDFSMFCSLFFLPENM